MEEEEEEDEEEEEVKGGTGRNTVRGRAMGGGSKGRQEGTCSVAGPVPPLKQLHLHPLGRRMGVGVASWSRCPPSPSLLHALQRGAQGGERDAALGA
eukprot:200020-Pyramimonas_sp.AAC.1